MALTRDSLRDFLQHEQGIDIRELDSDDAELFSSGLIDSFGIMNLIQFIETQCGFEVDPTEINLENMDSVSKILAYASTRARA